MLATTKNVAAKAPRAMKSASLTDLLGCLAGAATPSPLMFPGLRMVGGLIPEETRLKGTTT
jgi:hypothetical protein